MAEGLDFVIVGSGFGGSVSALRLTEKGRELGLVDDAPLLLGQAQG